MGAIGAVGVEGVGGVMFPLEDLDSEPRMMFVEAIGATSVARAEIGGLRGSLLERALEFELDSKLDLEADLELNLEPETALMPESDADGISGLVEAGGVRRPPLFAGCDSSFVGATVQGRGVLPKPDRCVFSELPPTSSFPVVPEGK